VDIQQALTALDHRVEQVAEEIQQMKSMRGWKLWQMRIWHLFFRPSSSFYAKVSRDYVSLYVYASCVSYTLCNWRIQESL